MEYNNTSDVNDNDVPNGTNTTPTTTINNSMQPLASYDIEEAKNSHINVDLEEIPAQILNTSTTSLIKKKTHKVYLILDRINALENTERNKFTWYITYSKQITSNAVYVTNKIKNILRMKLYDFQFNNISVVENDLLSRREYSPITITIPELSAQSFQTENHKFHFIGTYNNKTPLPCVNLSGGLNSTSGDDRRTYNNGGIFEFNDIMTMPNTLSIQFGLPFNPISLKPYMYTLTQLNVGWPGFSVANDVGFSMSHGTYVSIMDTPRSPNTLILYDQLFPPPFNTTIAFPINTSTSYWIVDTDHYPPMTNATAPAYFPDLAFRLHLELDVEFIDEIPEVINMPLLKQLYIKPKMTTIYLDIKLRNLFRSNGKSLSWDLYTPEALVATNRYIRIPYGIQNIIGAKTGAFNFDNMQVQLAADAPPVSGWCNILIDEFKAQSFMLTNEDAEMDLNIAYHTPYKLIKSTIPSTNTALYHNSLIPLNTDYYMFNTPIRYMPETITLFMSIWNSIVYFPKDMYSCYIFLIPPYTKLRVSVVLPDNIQVGDIIYLYNVQSNQADFQDEVAYLNRIDGHVITSITRGITNTDIMFSYDITGLVISDRYSTTCAFSTSSNVIPLSLLHY